MSGTNAIAEREYKDFVAKIDEMVTKARTLGLWRTSDKLHHALNEARSEMWEALPKNVPYVLFKIGPVKEQKLGG
jgi:hypothetical protein